MPTIITRTAVATAAQITYTDPPDVPLFAADGRRNVGAVVGTAVGAVVGDAVGIRVGVADGPTVGAAVGVGVGAAVGISVPQEMFEVRTT